MNQLNFNLDYLDFVKERITVMKDLELQNLVLEYCINYSKNNNKSNLNRVNSLNLSFKNINDRLIALQKKSDDKINNIVFNENEIYKGNETNNTIIFKKNNIIYKSTKANVPSLVIPFIEALIQVTLYYYSHINNLNSIVDCSYYISKTGKLYQAMEFIDCTRLDTFIKNLYNTNNYNNINKNKKLFNVFKRIAEELNKLQEICGFINGDLHMANIFVNYKSNSDIQIIFIDFGYSVVRLPNNLILSSKNAYNLGLDMDLIKNDNLKAIDLFHLFRDIHSFIYKNNKAENEKFGNKPIFKNFLIGLFNILGFNDINPKNLISSPHKFSRGYAKKQFFNKNLIPSNFIELDFDDIVYSNTFNSLKSNQKPNNILSAPKKSRRPNANTYNNSSLKFGQLNYGNNGSNNNSSLQKQKSNSSSKFGPLNYGSNNNSSPQKQKSNSSSKFGPLNYGNNGSNNNSSQKK
jgi:hypothetical protein